MNTFYLASCLLKYMNELYKQNLFWSFHADYMWLGVHVWLMFIIPICHSHCYGYTAPWVAHSVEPGVPIPGSGNSCIDRTLERTFNAPTNAGERVTSNIACACSQQYTKDSVFWFAQMMCVLTLRNCRPLVGPNVNSDGWWYIIWD